MSIYDLSVRTIDGESQTLEQYRGKVMLVVNTASKCGLTPQFAGLETLHQEFEPKGLKVLGFPCNQFAGQDPGSNDEIASFCQKNYGVTFAMHDKINVNGKNTHPLFEHLKSEKKGLLGVGALKWNFTKFLVGADGTVLQRFGPRTPPREMREAIVEALPKAD